MLLRHLEGSAIEAILESCAHWCSDDDGSCWSCASWLNGYRSCWCGRHSRHRINGEWCCCRHASIISCVARRSHYVAPGATPVNVVEAWKCSAIEAILESCAHWCSDDDGSCWNRASWLNGYRSCWCGRHSRHRINGEWCCCRHASIISCVGARSHYVAPGATPVNVVEALEGSAIEAILESCAHRCSDDDGSCWNRASWLNGYRSCWCGRHSRHRINGEWCCCRHASIISCVARGHIM